MSGPKAPAAPIPVVTREGKVGYLPAEYAEGASGHGLRQATDRELRGAQIAANEAATKDALAAKFSGDLVSEAEGVVMPALTGAARGLSLGLSDQALTEIGGDAVRKRLVDYQSYAPITSMLGEVGGIAAGALLGDEAALGSIPNAVGRLGAGAERFVARGLGEGLAARGAGVLARGGVEGGVFGVGSALTESALKDTDLTGESIIGGAAHGALGGMVASGLLHGAGKAFGALRKPSATAYDALAAQEFGEAAPGLGKKIAPEVESVAGKAKPHPEDVLTDTGGPYRSRGGLFDATNEKYIDAVGGENQKTLREAYRNGVFRMNEATENLEKHSRDLSEMITAQQKAARVTDMATFGESKTNHMEKLVSPSRFQEQVSVVDSWAQRARQELAPLVGDVNGGLSNKTVQQFDGHLQRLTKAAQSGDGAKLFTAADDMKRWLGKQAEFGRSALGMSEAARTFDGLYHGDEGLMRVLEHGAWGKAGAAQKAVNAATAESISLGKRFRGGFTAEHGATLGRPDYVADTARVSGFLGKLTKASNDLDAQGVRDMIATRRRFLEATEQSYDHGPQATAAIKAERQALDAMEKTFETATKETALFNQVQKMHEAEQASHIGGVLGLALDTMGKPVTTLRRLAQVQEQTEKVTNKIRGSSRSLVGAPSAPGAAPAQSSGAGVGFFSTLLKSVGDKGADASAMAAGAVGSQLNRKDFETRSDAISRLQAQPALLTKKVGDALAPLGEAAPKTMGAATSTAMLGVNFLASKMPMSRQDPYSLTPQFRPASKASDSEIAQHMRYQEALDNPTVVLDKALKGNLTPEHVEAVKAVYPKLYDTMRTEIFQGLVDAKSPLPYGRRIQLGILLDLPTDATLAPDFVSAIQATYAPATDTAGQEPPPPNLASLDVASSLETATEAATGSLDR